MLANALNLGTKIQEDVPGARMKYEIHFSTCDQPVAPSVASNVRAAPTRP